MIRAFRPPRPSCRPVKAPVSGESIAVALSTMCLVGPDSHRFSDSGRHAAHLVFFTLDSATDA